MGPLVFSDFFDRTVVSSSCFSFGMDHYTAGKTVERVSGVLWN